MVLKKRSEVRGNRDVAIHSGSLDAVVKVSELTFYENVLGSVHVLIVVQHTPSEHFVVFIHDDDLCGKLLDMCVVRMCLVHPKLSLSVKVVGKLKIRAAYLHGSHAWVMDEIPVVPDKSINRIHYSEPPLASTSTVPVPRKYTVFVPSDNSISSSMVLPAGRLYTTLLNFTSIAELHVNETP